MSENCIRLNGRPVHIVFRNESTFYTVMRFRINDETEKTITVAGIFADVELDTNYNIYGHYVEHPRYGLQFAAESYEKPLPSEREGVIRFLSGSRFPGIGKKAAEGIVDVLGEDCIRKIREDASVLDAASLTDRQKMTLIEGLKDADDGMEQLIRFLQVHGIGMRNLVRLNRTYGREALSRLKENPYRVIEECDGFGFATADKIAMSLGFAKDDQRRLYAFLVSLVMDLCVRSGDSYVLYGTLAEEYTRRTRGLPADFDEILDEAVIRQQLVREEDRIYPVTQHDAEKEICSFLQGFPYRMLDPVDDDVLDSGMKSLQKSLGIRYDDTQMEAVDSFFRYPFLIVTGGPGTGKTTVVNAMVKLFRLLYPSCGIVCAAPTGRAAKRLAEMTESPSATIHSLLQWDLESNRFGRNEEHPITEELLIIDEFSMVDAWLFSNLLKASRNVRKICIIGDEDQLPSVGPGCVLRDLIACGQFPVIRLDHIYRQESGSDVIALAHEIRSGSADLSAFTHDVAFFSCREAEIRRYVLAVVQDAVSKNYTMNDIQVLSPMYKGAAGIDTLNSALQEFFNPPDAAKAEVRHGYTVFREGDKILQLKNQPDDGVYNGDIGVLEEIEDASVREDHKTALIVSFQDTYVEYTQDNWNNITLAYCISVHKAQGSEYPIVIMPFSRSHTIMMQRKLIYTAVTRARRSLVMIGDREVFEKGIATTERHERATTLQQRLKEAMNTDIDAVFDEL